MSRTIDELLTEALVHFDAATEYAQVDRPGPADDPGCHVDETLRRLGNVDAASG